MIRYFLQGRFGPWYEVEEGQWRELNLVWPADPVMQIPYGSMPDTRWSYAWVMKAVWVNTSVALREDVKSDYPGLQDLIWFPDMRCGDCNGRLVDENAYDPDIRWPRYVHATATSDRHGAWPVERWDD